jgi:isoquinoline 1-oxidoreductase beta subunit
MTVRNCTRDEGGPFEVGNQVLISSHRKLLLSKSNGGERCGKAGTRYRQARLREASASEPSMKCRKRIRTRALGIPTVADRIAQEVARRYLEPRLEPVFHADSYGYRPGKSAIDAVRRARQRCWRYDWVLDLDVKAYCEVWVGSQVMARAQAAAAKTAGLPLDKVVVHNHLIGGGFGRRLEVDGVIRAVEIAKHVDGPVKVVWTREEDIQHDMYRPAFFDRISAGLDEKGMPVAWNNRFAGSSIIARWLPPGFNNGLDPDTTEGAIDLVYALPSMHVEYVRVEPPGIPTAFWRSVGPSHNVFVTESFMDELAAAAKQDAVAYRRALLDKAPRAKAVLELAAQKAGWGQPLPARVGRGVSVQFAFATYLAQVAEVEVGTDGAVRVRRVVCAVDCGTVVNPDTVQAQIQSAVIFGVTAALYGKITLKDGRVEQTNFDSYQILRMNEAPAIEVHIVRSFEPPGGMGEAGTSTIAPAVTNAIFAAIGKRLRKLPIDTTALKQPV